MRCAAYFAVVVCLLTPAGAVGAAEQWLKLKSAHFDLYTSAGEGTARETLQDFEKIRGFFVDALGVRADTSSRARLVVFRSEKEFAPYRLREFSRAYYAGSEDHDYIVIARPGPDLFGVAVHEYFHLVVKQSGLKLPVWLNEGLAVLYETLRPEGSQLSVGVINPGRYELLRTRKLMDLATLVEVGHDSPHYQKKELAELFYAQSWALAHMLQLGRQYRPKWSDFVKALASGESQEDTFRLAYGESLAEVQRDLQDYLRGNSFFKALFNTRLEGSTVKPTVEAADPLERGLVLANVLALANRTAEARRAFAALAAEHPRRWEVEEAQVYFAVREKSYSEARLHCSRAAELGCAQPALYYQCALHMRTDDEHRAKAIPMLRKAVELKPDYPEARYHLGIFLMEEREYQEALHHLQRIPQVSAERAGGLFRALAYLHLKTGNLPEAQVTARRARQSARTPGEIAWADQLLEDVSRARENPQSSPPAPWEAAQSPETRETPRLATRMEEPPAMLPKPAEGERKTHSLLGTLEHLDCLGRSARLRIRSEGKPLAFAILDPEEVVIKNTLQGSFEFACGPQKPRTIRLEYHPRQDSKLGTLGVIVAIEFP